VTGPVDVITPPELAGDTYVSTVRNTAAELKTMLVSQTLKDVQSWEKAVETQWRRAHPDWAAAGIPPIPPDEVEGYRNRVRNDYYEWVVPAFERYLTPDPDAADAMINALATIEGTFQGSVDDAGRFIPAGPGLSRIIGAQIEMSHWQGGLQPNFVDNFLSPLQNVAHNEGTVAKVARELLLFNKINYIRHRKSVLTLLDQSKVAVKGVDDKDPKAVMWGVLAVTAIGTVLGAGSGMVLAVGTGLDVAATLVEGLLPEPKEKPNDLSAPTAQEVAVNINDAMIRLDTEIVTGDAALEKAFKDLYDTICGLRQPNVARNVSGPLNVARPKLADASAAAILHGGLTPDR
jgi:hypothetical protein